tara:strand:+ start:2203 stop:3198 length:996 start_codon:yes stop_codon:yes gene_type:complete
MTLRPTLRPWRSDRAGTDRVKLLFITSNRLGDAVLSTGLLNHLIQAGDVRTTVACGPVPSNMFASLPGLDRIIAIPKKPRGGHWRSLWQQCIGTRWDQIIDLRASPVSYFLRAGRRRVMFKAGEGHRVESLTRWYGVDTMLAPCIWSAPEHKREADEAIPDGPPILGLAPTANWQGKIWPADRFLALANRLTGPGGALPGARIAIFGGPGEQPLAAPILEGLGPARCIDLVGQRNLIAAAESMRRCALVVSNDSGLMHLAAAGGAPTLGLFGPSRMDFYAPWGDHTASIATEIPFEDLFGPGYDTHTTGSLMTSLSMERVHEAAIELLERL